ncbi:uncharacterized protein LOC143188335 [Calliopsis andreniformis]|uniref:uncharacterized protein LOC143188335 n=1 Tax=Calliopsis andreniformis TaxID=337506 RepID=UPI003FCC7D6C
MLRALMNFFQMNFANNKILILSSPESLYSIFPRSPQYELWYIQDQRHRGILKHNVTTRERSRKEEKTKTDEEPCHLLRAPFWWQEHDGEPKKLPMGNINDYAFKKLKESQHDERKISERLAIDHPKKYMPGVIHRLTVPKPILTMTISHYTFHHHFKSRFAKRKPLCTYSKAWINRTSIIHNFWYSVLLVLDILLKVCIRFEFRGISNNRGLLAYMYKLHETLIFSKLHNESYLSYLKKKNCSCGLLFALLIDALSCYYAHNTSHVFYIRHISRICDYVLENMRSRCEVLNLYFNVNFFLNPEDTSMKDTLEKADTFKVILKSDEALPEDGPPLTKCTPLLKRPCMEAPYDSKQSQQDADKTVFDNDRRWQPCHEEIGFSGRDLELQEELRKITKPFLHDLHIWYSKNKPTKLLIPIRRSGKRSIPGRRISHL